MSLLQQIGAWAGFAAVIGLAVLSALYFAQAREVRRLREWLARAERAGPRLASVEIPPEEAREEGRRAPAEPAAASAAGAGAAAAAGPRGAPPPGPASSVTALRPGSPAASPQVADRAPARAPGPGAASSVRPGGAGPGAGNGSRGAGGAAPPRSPGPIVTAPARADRNGRPGERSAWPYLALAVVGLLIVLGAAAFALGVVGGRSVTAPSGAPAAAQPRAPAATTIPPSQITFSVLNGTSVDGLGKRAADQLEAAGYRRGNVTNASRQRATSTVMYAPGARDQALEVARRLHVRQTAPIDAPSRALAGDARVVVLVGADRSR